MSLQIATKRGVNKEKATQTVNEWIRLRHQLELIDFNIKDLESGVTLPSRLASFHEPRKYKKH